MVVNSPIISGTVSSFNSVPNTFNTSTFLVKGGQTLPSNLLGETSWVPIENPFDLEEGDFPEHKEITVYPDYAGQLFWSSVVSNAPPYYGLALNPLFDTFNLAKLYVSIPSEWSPTGLLIPGFVWVPVFTNIVTFYKDAATGKKWDPMGAVVCNPPFLCADT